MLSKILLRAGITPPWYVAAWKIEGYFTCPFKTKSQVRREQFVNKIAKLFR